MLVKLATKIAAGVSVLVVGGLVALAVPVFTAIGQAANETAERVSDIVASPEPTAAEPVAESASDIEEPRPGFAPEGPLDRDGRVHVPLGDGSFVAVLPGSCMPVYITDKGLLGTLIDHGANDYASGTAIFDEAGKITSYEVAAGDTLIGISERFCMADAHLFYANDMHVSGQGSQLAVGQVLILDPGA